MNRHVPSTDDRAKNRRSHFNVASWFGVLLLIGTLGAGDARAQTVCTGQPWLGTNGPEICVEIRDEGTLDTITRRLQGTGGTVNETVGTWRANLTFTYTIGPAGMSLTIQGEVWRQTPGTGWLNVRADGGTNITIAGDTGSLWLDGTATAASGTVLGGAAGVRLPGGGDIQFTGFPRVIEQTTQGPGAFHGEIDEIPIGEVVAGVANTTGFHVNEVGDLIDIPSGSVTGDPPSAPDSMRRWRDTNVDSGFVPMETRLVASTTRQDQELTVTSIRYSRTEDHLDAFRVSAPFGPENVYSLGEVDQGFLFSLHKGCILSDGRPFFAYIKGDAASLNVWGVTFNGSEFTIQQVDETVADDYHSVTCFNTSDGDYLQAFNFTDRTVEIYKLAPGGVFELWWILRDIDLGGTPGGGADLAAISKAAGDVATSTAVMTVGMADGNLTIAEIRPEAMEVTGLLNVGPANGETSANLFYDERLGNYLAFADWLNGDDLWHSKWDLGDLGSEHRIKVGTVEGFTVVPQFQGVSGARSSGGDYYLLADKCYAIDEQKSVSSELPSYPYRTMGGPVDLWLVGNSEIEGFAVGPGSLRLGILNHAAPVSELAVPAVARVRGAGALFTSIMHLFNGGPSDLELEMTFTPRDGSGGEVTTVSHTVPAGVLQTIEDPLESLFGFGGSAGRVGSVLITVTSGSTADLMVQTLVFAELDSGEEYGQFFPAMRIDHAISAGQTVFLNTTEDPARNRVNIGLMAVTDGTSFKVTPVDPLGTALATPESYTLDLGGNTQINNIHTTFGLGTMANVVVEVEVVTGSGLAYASVLDGSGSYDGTSDPTTILPVSGGSERVTLLEIGSIQGLNEFSGSASVTNFSEQTAAVRADFFQRGVFGVSATEALSIAAGETLGFSDLGADLFGVSGDVGSVVMNTTNGALIGATGREFAVFRDNQGEVIGTAGQLIAGQIDGDRLVVGRTYHFIGLRQERGGGAVERSHFAVFNPGWGDVEVTVRLHDGASGNLEGEQSWIVAGRTLIQVNNVIRAINSGYDDNEKRIEVEVDGPVFMNAFRVNRWGDPVTLSPFPG